MAVALVLGAAFAVLRLELEGPGLADIIASVLNKRMRGRIEVGSIEWSTASLTKAITGGWIPVTVRHVRLWDDCALSAPGMADAPQSGDPNADCTPDDHPDASPTSKRKPRKLLLATELVTAEIDAHAIMFGNHDFVFRNVWVHGGDVLIEQTFEPFPLHAYQNTVVSFISAFRPRQHARFSAGITADAPPPIFDLRDYHIEGVSLALHFAPSPGDKPGTVEYAFTGHLENVSANLDPGSADDSFLYMDGSDPIVSKFYVRLAVNADRGKIRILDTGPTSAFRIVPASTAWPPPGRDKFYEFNLTQIKLDRLAQLPSNWARRDFVANTLEVELHAHTLPCTPDGEAGDPAAGADLHLSGQLFNYFDRPYDGAWDLKLDGKNLGPTVRTCVKPAVGGDHLDGVVSLSGPFVAQPAINLDLTGIDYDAGTSDPVRLTLAELHGKIDLVNEEGYIEKTKALVRNGKEPGEIELSANFGLKPLYLNAQVEIVKALDIGRFLPPKVATSVGKFLHGRLRAQGDTVIGFQLSDFDLALGMTERDAALRLHHGRVFSKNSFGRIEIENVYADAGKSHAVLDGSIDIDHDNINLDVDGNFPDLDVWLARFKLPALAKSAGGGRVKITGKLSAPTINVNTTLGGIPCIDELRLDNLTYAGDTVEIQKLSSPGLGGELTGSGRIRIGGALPVIDRFAVKGSRLDASKLCGLKGVARGTIDELAVDLKGTIDAKRPALEWLGLGQIYARADKLTIAGDHYSDVAACVNRKDDATKCRAVVNAATQDDLAECEDGKRAAAAGGTGFCAVARAKRNAGGTLATTIAQLPATRSGRVTVPAHLAGVVKLTDLPLALIDELRGKPGANAVGGLASLTAQIAGTASAPQVQGTLQILRAWLASGFLGDAQITVLPTTVRGVPGLALAGSALAGRLAISGSIGTAPPFPVEVTLSGQRIEVDPFLDLKAGSDPLQIWASGSVTVRAELGGTSLKQADPEAWIELSELTVQLDHRASDGRITPLVMRIKDQRGRARNALSIHATPAAYELACRDAKAKISQCSTVLETPAGDIEIAGHAETGQVEITAHGDLDIAKLRVLLDQQFDYVAGRVALDVKVAGELAKPKISVELGLGAEHPIRLRPVGSDTVITAAHGQILLANDSLGFNGVVVQARDDRHADDQGELTLGGNIKLDGVTPTQWGLILKGKLAGKLLQVIAPSVFAQTDGLIDIDGSLNFTGKGKKPVINGSLLFDHLSAIPRAVHRELTLQSHFDANDEANQYGTLDISTVDDAGRLVDNAGDHPIYKFDIDRLNGSIDDGRLSNIGGTLQLRDGEITKAEVALDATSIPFRIPQTLDLALSADNVRIALASKDANWRVTGTIAVVDGAYLRNFEITDTIQAIGTNSAPSTPFWEVYPKIGNADLDLSLVVQRFAVKNNAAAIEFHADQMTISGTPRDPRLAGQIRVTHGEFRIPLTRASFTRTSGSVDFSENQAASNPELHLQSEADYRDLSGQDHVITATIGGTLRLLTWDLRTSTGYNKSQTLSLLLLGRNPDQLRRSLGDQTLGSDPTRVDPTTNPSSGFADQIVKDLAGDWVSGLLGGSLTKLTGLDVLRLEIGVGSIGVHVEKKVLENAKLLGDAEQTIRGTTIKVQGELKTPYEIRLQGGYLNQNYYDPAEQDITDYNLKLAYRVFIP
ncbi:MAG TPA: translocation/assembly module TamB domain-containing protein [Kofleriaceae bacterium]|nr:translocation/assembly module TamB domain-containing protein [Kofleriaceae bacterium]